MTIWSSTDKGILKFFDIICIRYFDTCRVANIMSNFVLRAADIGTT